MNKIAPLNNKSYYCFLNSSLSVDDIINYSINNNINYASLIDNNLFGSMEFYNKCQIKNIKPIIGLEIKINKFNYILIAKNYDGFRLISDISSMKINPKEIIESNNDNLIYISNDKKHQNHHYDISLKCFYESYSKNKEDTILKELLNCIKDEKTMNDYQIKNFQYTNNFLGYINELKDNEKKIILDIIQKIDIKIPKNINNFVDFETNKPKDIFFKELIMNNIEKKTKNFKNKNKEKYLERINYEFEIIKNKNFIDYFLVVQDFINYAKNNKIIIGPGRGSSAGSLISYALNITEIDPLEHNLLFERFLNEERCNMPDIDIDIMDNKREELLNYLTNKYGQNNVAHIITFSRFKTKMAIRDLGRVFSIPLLKIDQITKKIIDDNDIELSIKNSNFLQEEYINYKYLFDFAKKILNIPRQYSIHAAGVVISQKPISSIIPTITVDNKLLTQYSMEFLEELGLIKIDLLGLRNLTTIDMIVKKIEERKKITIDVYKIPTNDANVFEFLSQGNTLGIFQLESPGMTNLIKKIQPKNLEDISIVSALYRPGAYSNIDIYLENRKNFKYNFDENLKDILQPTFGTIIYQEQIIDIVKKIANFTPSQSDTFRKAISKKNKDEIIKMKSKFIENGINNNYQEETLTKIFNFMLSFASYGFNHSHSISYALISYIIAYLKYYFPVETLTILLSTNSTKTKLYSYHNEALKLGIKLIKPNINISMQDFVLYDNKIYFSFNSIANISNETSYKIINIRNKLSNGVFNSAHNAIILLISNNINKIAIENLIKVGSFDELESNRELLLESIEFIKINKKDILENEEIWLNHVKKYENYEINTELYKKWEKDILGISFFDDSYIIEEKIKNKYSLSNDTIIIKPYKIQSKISKNNNRIKLIYSNFNNQKKFLYIFDYKLMELSMELNKTYIVKISKFKSDDNSKFLIINEIVKEVSNEF